MPLKRKRWFCYICTANSSILSVGPMLSIIPFIFSKVILSSALTIKVLYLLKRNVQRMLLKLDNCLIPSRRLYKGNIKIEENPIKKIGNHQRRYSTEGKPIDSLIH